MVSYGLGMVVDLACCSSTKECITGVQCVRMDLMVMLQM